jgi:hypothetical protein
MSGQLDNVRRGARGRGDFHVATWRGKAKRYYRCEVCRIEHDTERKARNCAKADRKEGIV